MKRDNKKNKADDSQGDPTPNSSNNSARGIENGDNGNPTPDETTTHTQNDINKPIVITIHQQKDWGKTVDGNSAEWASVKVNGGLLFCTIVLAIISIWQGCLTRQSITIASNVLKADTAYNNKTLKNQQDANKKADDSAYSKFKRDTATFNLQKQSVDGQIASLKETQKEFDIENKPRVQIVDLALENVVSGGKPVIRFNFKNYGKQPVKMMNNKIQTYYWHERYMPPFDSKYQIDTISGYLGEGALYQEKRTIRTPITKSDSIAIKKGLSVYYINGYLPFKNIATNTESIYYYRYRIGFVAGEFNSDGIRDTTIEIAPKKEIRKKSKK